MLLNRESLGTEARPGPGRPRDAELDALILDAAVGLLDSGAEITVTKVVERSGVSRAAIYRRWPSITALTAAALDVGRTSYPEVRPSDNLRDALMETLMPPQDTSSAMVRGYPTHRFHQRLKLMIDNPELRRAYWESHVAKRRAPLESTLQESVTEGLLRPDLDVAACVDALAGVVYYQLVVRGEDLYDADTRARVSRAFDTIWHGMLAHRIVPEPDDETSSVV